MKRGPFSARTGPETLKNEIKMNPKNNFKRCHKSDNKLTILRLNEAKKKSRETECDVKNDSKYQNEGEF